jgi:hypothetical protein
MRNFSNKWMMYHEIHKRDRTGMKPSQIASFLVMDTRTVKKYLAMDEQEYIDYQEMLTHRSKKLSGYENFVKRRIEACPEASSAQVQDWLKECHPDFQDVSQKSIYNFVLYVRDKYNLPKLFNIRPYCMVEELPYGKQVQADMGEFNMTDMDSHRKKVYFFAIVMARSRFKFVVFQEQPFTTKTLIIAHEQAFAFIGGYPQEMVYDQDKVILKDENIGSLILTGGFRAYHQNKPFKLHFCRKSDPESKGKVEIVIKYIKYNFLRGRTFYNIHTLNAQAIEWLERTANAKEHDTTRKVPAVEWVLEKAHLIPLKEPIMMKQDKTPYRVRKDNTISFRGNYYTLPVGTYKGHQSIVIVEQKDDELIICDSTAIEIACHKISVLKGILVRNSNHYRDHAKKVTELITQVSKLFSDEQKATNYLEQIHQELPRYARDHIKLIAKVCSKYTREEIDRALQYCINNKIYNATDFEPVLLALSDKTTGTPEKCKTADPQLKNRYKIIPQTSNITDYKQILN